MGLGSECELRSLRAAKQHLCHLFGEDGQSSSCTEYIDAGDLYIENMDSAADYQSGTRYCIPCAVEQFGIDPGLIGDERGEGPAEAGDMEKTDGLGASSSDLCVCGHPVAGHDVAGCPSCSCPNPVPQRRQQGEVYANTDPEHWPDGRPTFGAGR